jgi:ribosomal-protein-alanine N-acetyltransferase
MIRKATAQDVLPITALIQQYEHHWTLQKTTDCMKPHYQLWVLEKESILGVLIVHLTAFACEIIQFGIDEKHHQQGFGHTLFQILIDASRAQRIQTIQLEVRASNQRAIDFYLKHDFNIVGKRKNYYADNEEAILMNFNIKHQNEPLAPESAKLD